MGFLYHLIQTVDTPVEAGFWLAVGMLCILVLALILAFLAICIIGIWGQR
jgi:hypothetical protein